MVERLWQPFFSLSPFPSPVGRGEAMMMRFSNGANRDSPR